MSRRFLSLFAVLALFFAAGCGDDSDSTDTEETTDTTAAPAETTSTTEEEEALALDDWAEQADEICAQANEDFDELDQLSSDPTAEELVSVLEDGLAIAEEQVESIDALGPPDEEAELAEEAVELLTDALGTVEEAIALAEDDDLEGAFELLTDPGDEERLAEIADDLGLEVCGGDDETTDTTVDTTDVGGDEPFTYGDDDTLDALWDDCDDGDGEACDDLFYDSPVDSEYEEFGNTCGGRFALDEVPLSCADEIGGGDIGAPTGGGSYGDDPELDALWDDCEDGDPTACDDLWEASEFGTEYYDFGFSCGGRVPEDEVQVCDQIM